MKLFAIRAGAALALAVAGLAACKSPSPNLYTLSERAGAVSPGVHKVILLRDISLPRYLDRIQIVHSSAGNRLEVMANDWWGEPLGAMTQRILVGELGQRLPDSSVYSEAGAVTARPDLTVELNIQRLDEDTDGTLVLEAQANVATTGAAGSAARSFRLTAPTTDPGIGAEVSAIDAVMGQLADGITQMIVSQ